MKVSTVLLASGALALNAHSAISSASASPSSIKWLTVNGDVCGAECGCTGDDCKDIPGEIHYSGKVSSSDDCQSACAAAGSANCSIWLWSSNTQHCFFRLDGQWDLDTKEKWVVSGCIEATDASDPNITCVPGCGSCQVAPAPAPTDKNYTNMNGEYVLSETKTSDTKKFPTHYREYPGQPDYFEVYSPPIVSLYSQVFWTRLPTIDLPKHIQDRFDGKTMAIVGFEMDQVRRTTEGDVKVPINVAYNHHFESTMIGNGARFERIVPKGPHDPRMPRKGPGHRRPNMSEAWIVVPDHELEAKANGISSSVAFGAANGGEYRKSFHGFAPGYAQLIHSPKQFSITPMQIDTWNRDKMDITGGPFVPGPVPRTSLAPTDGPDALYSGLLECPLTTRLRKELKGGAYEVRVQDTCANGTIATAAECFQAAKEAHFPVGTNLTYSSASMPGSPPGCLAMVQSEGVNASVSVMFNTAPANATATCGASSGSAADLVTAGFAQSLVTLVVSIDTPNDLVTINMTGPADVWFGVGFDATQMKDSPWAIVVEPTSGSSSADATVSERKLQDQSPGKQLTSSITVTSHTVDTSSNTRTIVATRALKGATSDYYTFNAAEDVVLNFINAVGSGPALAYHKSKTASQIALLPVAASGDNMCICPVAPAPFGEGFGTLVYTDGSSVGCCNHCQPEPRTDMLEQQNPTCDLRTYVGGQLSCHHMWSLLDADQDIPWQDQPLNYSLKFRFWFEEYNANGGSFNDKYNSASKVGSKGVDSTAASHINVQRTTWGIASPVEYDVPKCDNQTLACALTDDGWIHTIKGTFTTPKNIKLVAAHFHCHAPTCLSVALYNNETGELICEEKPIYGGHGAFEPGFDEPGYITQPPCLWGDAEFGLDAPPEMGMTLHAVKTSNATYGHHGEMAWMQMFYVNA